MAGSFSDYFENKVLEWICRANFTAPTEFYVGLWTATLSDTSTGATAGEVSGGSYARVNVTPGTGTFDAASSGATANTGAITFPTATASWGTITHMAVLDAASTGNILFWADLTASKSVGSGDTFTIAAGDLDITVS